MVLITGLVMSYSRETYDIKIFNETISRFYSVFRVELFTHFVVARCCLLEFLALKLNIIYASNFRVKIFNLDYTFNHDLYME